MGAVKNIQSQLFGTENLTAKRDYDPARWHEKPDVVWHASGGQKMPGIKVNNDLNENEHIPEGSSGPGFHTGTLKAAMERSGMRGINRRTNTLHPLVMTGQHVLPPDDDEPSLVDRDGDYMEYMEDSVDTYKATGNLSQDGELVSEKRNIWNDEAANYSEAAHHEIYSGHNIPYKNKAEDVYSVSYRSPRENLHTWRESVQADSNAPSQARAVAEHGYELHYKPQSRVRGEEYQQVPLDGPGTPGMGLHGLSGPSKYSELFHTGNPELRKPRNVNAHIDPHLIGTFGKEQPA